jgi:hypothetical protein
MNDGPITLRGSKHLAQPLDSVYFLVIWFMTKFNSLQTQGILNNFQEVIELAEK